MMGEIKACKASWVGWGHEVGALTIDNGTLERSWGVEPGWIERRTGIVKRRYADPHQATSDLAESVGRQALTVSGIDPRALGMVFLATSTPDHPLPGTAPAVAERLGTTAPAVDLAAACSGFIYGLMLADHFVRATGRPVLLIGANVLSRRVNRMDPQTGGLFGDAAGAVVLAPSGPQAAGVEHVVAQSDGRYAKQLFIEAGGSRVPWQSASSPDDCLMQMPDGRLVFRLAVEAMVDQARCVLAATNTDPTEVDWLLPHQASRRIVNEVGTQLGVPAESRAWWLSEFGNSSAATLPVALSLGRADGRIRERQRLLLTAAGAGFCSGAAMLTT